MLVVEGLIGFIEPFNFSFFSITGRGIDWDHCDTEWFVLEMNKDHSVIFEIASKYCISDSFVDYVKLSNRKLNTMKRKKLAVKERR